MTKAKQLAQSYLDAPPDQKIDTIQVICNDFLDEVFRLLRVRNPSTDAGAISILRELDAKWRTMSRMTDGAIVEDGFVLLVRDTMPPLSGKWEKSA